MELPVRCSVSPAPPVCGRGSQEGGVTSQILLIRHAAHSHYGQILSGRTPGLGLSARGSSQAARLAQRCASMVIDSLQTSPVQRARETAEAMSHARGGQAIEEAEDLDEL